MYRRRPKIRGANIALPYENTTQNGTAEMPWGNYPAAAGPARTAVQSPEPATPALRLRAIAASCAVMPPASCDTRASFTRL